MTILERLYASSGSEVIHDTLQISAGDDNYWLTSGWDDVSVMLENGQPATFEASAIDIALPAGERRRDTGFKVCYQQY